LSTYFGGKISLKIEILIDSNIMKGSYSFLRLGLCFQWAKWISRVTTSSPGTNSVISFLSMSAISVRPPSFRYKSEFIEGELLGGGGFGIVYRDTSQHFQ
jgi:hypothetical protein